jgi:ABC-2 type transport system permease protein
MNAVTVSRLNIFRRELRAGRRSFLGWTIASALLGFLTMSAFPSIESGALNMNEMVKNLPEAMRAAFGLGALDMSQPVGYYATRGYFMATLLGALFTTILGAGLLAKEEGERTAEFLLSKPVSRASVLGQKALALLLFALLYNIASAAVVLISFGFFVTKPFSLDELSLLFLGQTLITLAFGGLGFLLSTAMKKTRGSVPIALGAVIGSYFLSTLAGFSEKLRWLRWLSPFRYADAIEMMKDGFSVGYALTLVGIAALAVALAFPLYQRKDIQA